MQEFRCRVCETSVIVTNKSNLRFAIKKGILCDECRKKAHAFNGKKNLSKRTDEQRSAIMLKNWEKVRADKPRYEQECKDRSIRMKEVWKKYTKEKRDYILTALVASNNYGRSKISERVKSGLIEAGLYENFISEECFHGFFPDEINHELKLIIEVYGDIYHCNPKKFHDRNLYMSIINRTVGEQWDRDKRRLDQFYKKGYEVIIVWESDWHINSKKEIKRIRELINKRKVVLNKA